MGQKCLEATPPGAGLNQGSWEVVHDHHRSPALEVVTGRLPLDDTSHRFDEDTLLEPAFILLPPPHPVNCHLTQGPWGLRGAQWTLRTELFSLSLLCARLCWTQSPQVTRLGSRVQTHHRQGLPRQVCGNQQLPRGSGMEKETWSRGYICRGSEEQIQVTIVIARGRES